MPSARGSEPPDSEVPEPRGTMGTPSLLANSHHGDHLGSRFLGKRRRPGGLLAIGGERIAIEYLQAGLVRHDAVRHEDAKGGHDFVAAGQDFRIGGRQFQALQTIAKRNTRLFWLKRASMTTS